MTRLVCSGCARRGRVYGVLDEFSIAALGDREDHVLVFVFNRNHREAFAIESDIVPPSLCCSQSWFSCVGLEPKWFHVDSFLPVTAYNCHPVAEHVKIIART